MKKIVQLSDLEAHCISDILEVAEDFEHLKSKYGELPPLLRGKTLGMIFDEPSLRTRSAFEIAMKDLGGATLHYRGDEARIGSSAKDLEHIKDFANVIGGFNDVILSRIYDNRAQVELAQNLPTNFINGMCDLHHPTQALCDLLTLKRRFLKLDGLKVAFVGDATNVAFSLAEGLAAYNSQFVLSSPIEYAPLVERFRNIRNFEYVQDPDKAVEGAHAVITDSWTPLNRKHELDERLRILEPYRVTEKLFAKTAANCIFMHNLPASRAHEVTAEVIDGPRSAVYEEAIARLHIARALLYFLLKSG
jgi:ornithine carbamoyltransferase